MAQILDKGHTVYIRLSICCSWDPNFLEHAYEVVPRPPQYASGWGLDKFLAWRPRRRKFDGAYPPFRKPCGAGTAGTMFGIAGLTILLLSRCEARLRSFSSCCRHKQPPSKQILA